MSVDAATESLSAAGLTVRWALPADRPDLLAELREYIRSTSLTRFSGMSGLSFKTWRAVPGRWFEGSYVFDGEASRDAFEAAFRLGAADSPVSTILGASPILIEQVEVVAVALGGAGLTEGVSA